MKAVKITLILFVAALTMEHHAGRVGSGNVSGAAVPPLDTLFGPLDIAAAPAEHASRAHPHPHGDKICASGCALSRHPTARLTSEKFAQLLQRLQHNPDDTAAMDELLYFGPQTTARLESHPLEYFKLSRSILKSLQEELRLTHARIAIRLVSTSGDLLADLPDQVVPLDIRHEFDLQEHGIPTLVASGTVKRVSQDRLWSRL